MKRKMLTPPVLIQRPPQAGRIEVRDSLSPLVLRITCHGNRSFIIRTRVKGQQQPIRLTYDAPAHVSVLEDARAWAVATVGMCRRGEDPRPLRAATEESQRIDAERVERNRFGAVAASFLEKHAAKNRSHDESKRILDFYTLPRWKERQMDNIARADVVALLDEIEAVKFEGEDGKLYGGPVMADRVLAQVRKLMNWHAARDASYVSPIVKGMARTKPKERARTRVLSDDEIRLIWPLLDELGTYGAVLKTLFYTAQRLGEVAQMARSQIGADGVWEIPAAAYKGKRPQFVPLTEYATATVKARDQVDGGDLVFPAARDASKQISIWSALKSDLDTRIAKANGSRPLPRWTVHDIRRTCRTLMSRAGVRPDISERVLGHVIAGVEGVYDRHSYVDEKRHALEALAATIDRTVNPAPVNVVPLARAAAE